MSFKKNLIKTLIVITASALPLVAQADKLTIVNDTNRDSTSIINGGSCSQDVLQEGGVTRRHATNTVSATNVFLACRRDPANCQADVYMQEHCKGPKIGTVIMDTSKGIKSVTMIDNSYAITGTGMTIHLTGGPAAKIVA